MPFTISHAAVVPPFSRFLARWSLLSAVVIGTMVPDFALFLPWRMYRLETHSGMALLTFCLPVGLCCYWLFQYLIKMPVIEVLPDGAYARWSPYAAPADLGSLKQWLLASLGVLGGAITHLIWDAFTHSGARGARMISWLEDPVVEIGAHHVVGARVMQDVSSLIGLIVVLLWVGYGLRQGRAAGAAPGRLLRRPERRVWVFAYLAGALVFVLMWLALARSVDPSQHGGHSVTGLATAIAIATLRGLASSFLVVSLGLDGRLRALHAKRAATPPSVID